MFIDNTSVETIQEIFEKQKANRINLVASTASKRRDKLKKLLDAIMNSQDEICEAVYADLRKSSEETKLTEIFAVTSEIKHAIRHVRKWMHPKRVKTPLAFFGSKNEIMYESVGQSLIISPWNYPFQLAVGPLVSAIAAGNTVILKPSEKSPHTSKLLEKMLNELYREDEVKVVLGDADVSSALTGMPFNHIFFTGSTQVGKLVMESASKNLTKVTLELGGKSPAIVHEYANIKTSALRIAWGKFMNAGQTCVAPDYLLVHESIKDNFVKELIGQTRELYGEGETLTKENNYCRMINEDHFNSVKEILDNVESSGAKIIHGGKVNSEDKFIAPTIIDSVNLNSTIMQREIFGPLLPIITYKNEEEIYEITSANPNPLALYVFSNNKQFTNRILKSIPAGSSAVNDCVIHFANYNLPFGGTNSSGLGKSHGYYGFKTFSNAKSLMKQSTPSAMLMLYPPYNSFKNKLIDIIIKYL